MCKEKIMSTSNIPPRDQVITDLDSQEVHDVPLRDLETEEFANPEDFSVEEEIQRGDVKDSHDR
jgi:hypothetical protein